MPDLINKQTKKTYSNTGKMKKWAWNLSYTSSPPLFHIMLPHSLFLLLELSLSCLSIFTETWPPPPSTHTHPSHLQKGREFIFILWWQKEFLAKFLGGESSWLPLLKDKIHSVSLQPFDFILFTLLDRSAPMFIIPGCIPKLKWDVDNFITAIFSDKTQNIEGMITKSYQI